MVMNMGKKLKFDSINLDLVFIIFAAGVTLSVILRSYQLMNGVIDTSNGCYFQPPDFTVNLLNALLIISSALVVILSYLSTNIPKSVLPKSKNKLLGTAGLILMAGTAYDAMSQVVKILAARNAGYASFGLFLSETGMIINILQAIFALLSAIYLLVFAISYYKGKNGYSHLRIMALAPVGWLIFRTIIRFTRDTNYIQDSELFFEFVMLCFGMLFFFALSRIASGIGSKDKMTSLFAFGFPAAIFSLLCFVPRIIMYIIGRSDFVIKTSPPEYADIAVAAFIIIVLLTILSEYKAGKYEEYDEDDVFFNFDYAPVTELDDAEDVLPPLFTQASANVQTEQAAKTDEAFEIAAQYSNQYVRANENVYVNQTQDYTDSAANTQKNEKKKNSQTSNKENGENPYIDPLPPLN